MGEYCDDSPAARLRWLVLQILKEQDRGWRRRE